MLSSEGPDTLLEYTPCIHRAFLIAQLVKNPLAMQETPAQFLGREDLLAKGQATHSSILGLLWWLCAKGFACNGGDLGWQDLVEMGKATHSSILAWEIP